MERGRLINALVAPAAFLLIMAFLILGILLNDTYGILTRPYFNFLHKIGYYKYIYTPDCHDDYCFFANLPDQAPYLLFVLLPVIGSIALFYYYLSGNKIALKRRFKSLFSKTAEDGVVAGIIEPNNKKHQSLFSGLLTAFFFLLGVFFILPALLFLFLYLFKP